MRLHLKIISGGQTGVDRAALDAAYALGLPTGGYASANFRTEHGSDHSLKRLGLIAGGTYASRTRLNVMHSDATLLITVKSSRGSDLTVRWLDAFSRAYLHLRLADDLRWGGAMRAMRSVNVCLSRAFIRAVNERDPVACIREWLALVTPSTLNVAGHRESVCPGIYARTYQIMSGVLA